MSLGVRVGLSVRVLGLQGAETSCHHLKQKKIVWKVLGGSWNLQRLEIQAGKGQETEQV